MRLDNRRLSHLHNNDIRILRYVTGSVGHWLFRRLCIAHNISYGNVCAWRINDALDHWVVIVRPDKPIETFTDLPLLP